MNLFLSWSKNKSKCLAEATKRFLEKVLGDSIKIFFSPNMYLGSCVDNEIHRNLLECKKCLVCITADNFKNPWLLYEAGVVYGANYASGSKTIVIPILFEDIPDWSSWIDKPLNRYVPIQMYDTNRDFSSGKNSFEKFLKQIADDEGIAVYNFSKNWNIYKNEIKSILDSEQTIPRECQDLYSRILENDNGTFSLTSPEIKKNEIVFYRGYKTHELLKVLIDSIIKYHGKYLWLYGRKHKLLMSREFDYFFEYLATEGLRNGVDFKCLFPMPGSPAAERASSKDRSNYFEANLKESLEKALNLKSRYNLEVGDFFRLYQQPQRKSIIRCDNAVLHHSIVCDEEGYPLPFTNSDFIISSAFTFDVRTNTTSEGLLIKEFLAVWNEAVPINR